MQANLLTWIGYACVLVGTVGFWGDNATRGFPGTRGQRMRFGAVVIVVGFVLMVASRS